MYVGRLSSLKPEKQWFSTLISFHISWDNKNSASVQRLTNHLLDIQKKGAPLSIMGNIMKEMVNAESDERYTLIDMHVKILFLNTETS